MTAIIVGPSNVAGLTAHVGGGPLPPVAVRSAPAAVVVRRVRPTDAPQLQRFYAELSPESRQLRFLGVVGGLSHRQATGFCTPDHDHNEGFVAVVPRSGREEARIVGHLCLEPDRARTAEVAIAIADDWQRHGLGRRLMQAGLRWASRSGVSTFCATMYSANSGIHRLLLGLGLPAKVRPLTPGVSEITIDLDAPAREAA